MSTSKIRKALDVLNERLADDPDDIVYGALAEVEAIEKAAHQFYIYGEEANVEAWNLMDNIGHKYAERKKQ